MDITNQSLLAQVPAPTGEPITMLRVVRSSTKDYARLAAVHRFVENIVEHGLGDVEQASRDLRAIQRMTRLYPKWVLRLTFAGLAGSVCVLLGGGLTAALVAMVAALAIDRVEGLLSKVRLPPFFTAAAGGAIATLCAWLAYLLTSYSPYGQMSRNDFAFAVAAGIVLLLPGQAMTSAVGDGITGYPVTGAGRLFTVFLTCSGIIAGSRSGCRSRCAWTMRSISISPPRSRCTSPRAPRVCTCR